MKIVQIEHKTPEFEQFEAEQWELQDALHFGHDTNWQKEKYLLEAKEGDAIVGILEMKLKGGVAKIESLLVKADRHRNGIGRKLLQQAENLAREAKAHKMYLITGKDWQAVRFYQEMGYEPEGVLKKHHQGEDFVQFAKFITFKG